MYLNQNSEFINAYLGLGTIDFATSLNELLASSTPRAPFCFARYTSGAEITAKNCWSPLLDKDTVVANDMFLGGSNQSTLVVTGPNARGKTTALRSVAGAALLSSTVSVGPAQDILIPENLAFLTSINVGDDPSKNLSLFKAVTERMGQIMNTLKDQATRPHLVVSDEPFVGTDKKLAETCARELIKKIAQRDNALALFSSHFDVKNLEGELTTKIANYHVAPGYKFVRGVDPNPEQYDQVALDIIADAFRDPEFVGNVRDGLDALRLRQ